MGFTPKNWIHHEYFLIKWPATSEIRNVDSLNTLNLQLSPGATPEEFNLKIDAQTRSDMTAMLTFEYLYKLIDVLRGNENSLSFEGSCSKQN